MLTANIGNFKIGLAHHKIDALIIKPLNSESIDIAYNAIKMSNDFRSKIDVFYYNNSALRRNIIYPCGESSLLITSFDDHEFVFSKWMSTDNQEEFPLEGWNKLHYSRDYKPPYYDVSDIWNPPYHFVRTILLNASMGTR